MAISIAEDYHISTTTFTNLIWSESRFLPMASSTNPDGSVDRGIAQINSAAHPEVDDACAYDPNCALQWAAGRIVDGHLAEWVAGNCYLLVLSKVPGLPKMRNLKPNGPPRAGGVAIFDYKGVPHYAYIKEIGAETFKVFESNYVPGLIGHRAVRWNDPALIGFWAPPTSHFASVD